MQPLARGSQGPWSRNYGDGNSRYAYAAADLSGVYTTAYNRVQRHVVHFKKPGTEEIIVQFDDVDASNSPTQIRDQVHYAQNGETNDGMTEGDTTCPGPNGCGGLDLDRWVVSQEDGSTGAHGGSARNYGIVSRFFSPRRIFVQDDGSNYPGAAHHTHRVSICGGPSCGSTTDGLEAVIVHKIAAINDLTLTAKALNPDGNWTGVQTTDKVALFSRGGSLRLMASFQTDQAGIAQYLIAGLQDGLTYRVHRVDNGSDIAQQLVGAGDNSLYFEAPAGSYQVFPVGLSNLILAATAVPRMQAGLAYRYDFKVAGDTTPFVWTVAGGRLPVGVTLSSDGVLSGTPVSSGSYVAAIRAVDGASSATYNVALNVQANAIQQAPVGRRQALLAAGEAHQRSGR